jgi:hypothetical protein
MRATHAIHAAAGAPDHGLAGTCRACGVPGFGAPFATWIKPTFTDHDKLSPGDIVCSACLFCFDDASSACAAALGKPEPQRMRNYSHFVRAGRWYPLSKGAKRKMSELVFDASTVVIATSGQKHLCFRCPAGWWQIEEHTARPFPGMLRRLSVPVGALYQGGFSKAEIESGLYDQRRVTAFGIGAWRDADEIIRQHRRTLPLQLAIFLAQKDEDTNAD